ncbi:MAG: CaiB/BaiF CoA transferase family protein [Crocinitomicaceae bacterium]
MFKGLKVIDLSTVLAGPSVGTFFAELDADVIKLEHPDFGDVTRSWKLPIEKADSNISAYFSSVNYGKKYGTINLKIEAERDRFLEEIRDTDILVSNFKKGDATKFGIEDEVLFAQNPKLIHGKITGYGEDSNRVAFDLILQAESGFMSINGTPESGPLKMPIALIDVLCAHHLKEAILLALYERERTRKGKSVTISLYDAAVSSLVNQASNYLMTGFVPKRIGSKHPNIAPYGELFKTKDGATVTFAIGSNTHFRKLCEVLGIDDLSEDQRFKNNQNRVVNRAALFELIERKVIEQEAEELLTSLQLLNVPAGKVRDLAEVFNDPLSQELIIEEEIDGIYTRRVKSVLFK